MKQTDYKYKYDNLRYNYNSLFIMQQRDKRYEDALQTLEELEKVVTDYQILPAKPNMEEVKRALTLLENHAILQRIEGKFNQNNCQIAILPTILSAVSADKLNLVVSVLRKEEPDEETEENPTD